MREFDYIVSDPMGFHARPAAQIFMEARKFQCSMEAESGEETADLKNLLSLMGLGVRSGGQLKFRFDGTDEEDACKALQEVLNKI